MAYTNRVSEDLVPLTTLFPTSSNFAIGTYYTDYVALSNYHRAWLLLSLAEMAGAATVDVGIQQAKDAIGTGVKAITGKVITQLTQASGDDKVLVCIELQTEELDVDGGFEFIRAYLTVAGNAVDGSLTIFGVNGRFKPVPTTNWAEIVG